MKQSLKEDVHAISIAGGKGKKATQTKNDIPKLAERYYNLSSTKIDDLLYASRMAAKIDNAVVQDCYSLYHNVILFDEHGDWAIIQQGMNPHNKMARRYHWNSKNLKSFVSEPHARIISECKSPNILNMTSIGSVDNQKICVELANGDMNNLKSSVYKVGRLIHTNQEKKNTLDAWIMDKNNNNAIDQQYGEHYEMPRRLRLGRNSKSSSYCLKPKGERGKGFEKGSGI